MNGARRSLPPLPPIVPLALSVLLPRSAASSAIGDLHEDFSALDDAVGRAGRVAWMARQAASLVLGYWLRRVLTSLRLDAGAGRGPRWWWRLRDREPLVGLAAAFKNLRRNPWYAAMVIATLAVGIGLNTAIFTVVNVALFAPVPYDATVSIDMEGGGRMSPAVESIALWRAQATALERVEGYRSEEVAWTDGTEPLLLKALRVTPELPRALGVEALIGRLFSADDGGAASAPVVVVSEALWRHELGADRGVLGQRMTLADTPYTIVGVLPAAARAYIEGDVVIPDSFSYGLDGFGSVRVFAWLAPGASFEVAQAQLAGLTVERNQRFGRARLYRPEDELHEQVRAQLLFLLGVVSLVLLIACANVANLAAARGVQRRRELAVRAALGAGRGRLVRELLTESLLLSLLAGAAAILLIRPALRLLASLLTVPTPVEALPLDARVLGWALAISLLAALLSGAWPALSAARPELGEALKTGGAAATTSRSQRRIRAGLVAAQMTVSLALLFGAGLLAGSLLRLYAIPPGFDAAQLLAMRVSLPAERYPEDAHRQTFYDNLFDRIERLEAVDAVTFTYIAPPFPGFYGPLGIDDESSEPVDVFALQAFAGPGFFRTFGIAVLRGSGFEDISSNAFDSVIINESFARSTWPGDDPIGHSLHYGGGNPVVVGVVADIHQVAQRLTVANLQAYHPIKTPGSSATIIVRVSGDPDTVVQPLKEQVWALDPRLPIESVETIAERLAASTSIATPRTAAKLLGAFSALALALACVGVVGVVANAVGERRREIGVRIALGADAANVRRLVLRQALTPVLFGAVLGAVGGIGVGRLLRSSLFEIGSADPTTMIASTAVLIGFALLAAWWPARRATRIDPLDTLRAE